HDTLIYNGLVHIGINALRVDPETNVLTVHGDDATGLVGVATLLGTATSFRQDWLPFKAGIEMGPYLETVSLTENQGAVEGEHVLGGSRVRHGEESMEYFAN